MGKCVEKEINWKLNLVMVWLGQILSMAGFAAITPFIPFFLKEKYNITDEKTLGLYVAAFTFFGMLSFCISAPIWGVLADKYGRKLMLLRAYFVTAFVFPLLYWAPAISSSVVLIIAIRFVVSAFSGTTTAAQTLLATNTPKEYHGFVLGVLSTSLWSGNMIGFVAGAFVVNYLGYFWSFTVCGLMYLAGGIITCFWVHEKFEPSLNTDKQQGGFFAGFRGLSVGLWLVLSLFMLMGIARRFDEPYLALKLENIVPDKAVLFTGITSMLAALGGLISGVVMGKLCDKVSPLKVAIPAAFVAAVTAVIQAFSGNMAIFAGSRFVQFVFAGGLEPAFLALLARLAPDEKRGTLFGIASGLRMIGILIAASSGAGVIYLAGVPGVFVASGVFFLILLPLLFFAYRIIKKNTTSNIKGE